MPPRKPRPNAGRVRIDIRTTPEQKAEIEAIARSKGLTPHAYVRSRVLGLKTPVLPEYIALDNLRTHRDELVAVYANGASDEVKEACIAKLRVAISGLTRNSKGKGNV